MPIVAEQQIRVRTHLRSTPDVGRFDFRQTNRRRSNQAATRIDGRPS